MEKASGDYLEQYVAQTGAAPLADMRGMFVVDGAQAGQPQVLVWADAGRLLATPLTDASAAPSPSPTASPSPAPSPKPTKKPKKTPKP
jgi:hypothetical protein